MDRFCRKCGAKLEENEEKCRYCGEMYSDNGDGQNDTPEFIGSDGNVSTPPTDNRQSDDDSMVYSWHGEKHTPVKKNDSVNPLRVILAVIFSVCLVISLVSFTACIASYGVICNLDSQTLNEMIAQLNLAMPEQGSGSNYYFPDGNGSDGSYGYYSGSGDDFFDGIFGDLFGDSCSDSSEGYGSDNGGYAKTGLVSVKYGGIVQVKNFKARTYRGVVTSDDWKNIMNDIECNGGLTPEDAVKFDRAINAARSVLLFFVIFTGIVSLAFAAAIYISLGMKVSSLLTPGIILIVVGACNLVGAGFTVFGACTVSGAVPELSSVAKVLFGFGIPTLIASAVITITGIVATVFGAVARKKDRM